MPTILDACEISPATAVDGVSQQDLDGATLRPTFDDPGAPAPRRTQYFEMLGSRGIYSEGWKATTDRVVRGVADEQRLIDGSAKLDTDSWLLFHLDDDFSEAHDLSAEHPDEVTRLSELWWAEAGRNAVLPMGDWLDRTSSDLVRAIAPPPFPQPVRKTFRPGGGPIADEAVPSLAFGGRVEADLQIPDDGAEGVICAQGNWTGGWGLFAREGRLWCVINSLGHEHQLTTSDPLATGRRTIACAYGLEADGSWLLQLFVDAERVASTTLPPGSVLSSGQADGSGLRIGHDAGFPVSDDYIPPFSWTGVIHAVTVEATPPPFGRVRSQAEDAVHRD
jgi:arylsulfatase